LLSDGARTLTVIRTIALDGATVERLKQHREAQLVERALAGDGYVDTDMVFCDELGNPLPPHWLSEQFLRLRNAAGIPTGTMHTLRHTAATLMLTNGVPLHVVAARLGDRPETLLRVYAHLLPQSDEGAAEGMAELVAGPTEALPAAAHAEADQRAAGRALSVHPDTKRYAPR
jgi:integrase